MAAAASKLPSRWSVAPRAKAVCSSSVPTVAGGDRGASAGTSPRQSGDLDPGGRWLGFDSHCRQRIGRAWLPVGDGVAEPSGEHAAQRRPHAFEVDRLEIRVGVVDARSDQPAVDQALGGIDGAQRDFGPTVETPQAIGEQPGVLLDRRRRAELRRTGGRRHGIGVGAQPVRGFFGMHRTDLRQTACAAGRVFRPDVELARVAQRRVEQQRVQPVAARDVIRKRGKRPRESHLEQRGRGVLRGLDRGGGIRGCAELGRPADQSERVEAAAEHVQAVGSVRVALQQLVGVPVAFAEQTQTGFGLRAQQRRIVGDGVGGRGEVLVAGGHPLRKLLLVVRADARVGGRGASLTQPGRRAQRVVVGRTRRPRLARNSMRASASRPSRDSDLPRQYSARLTSSGVRSSRRATRPSQAVMASASAPRR